MNNGIIELPESSFEKFIKRLQKSNLKLTDNISVKYGVADFALSKNMHGIWDGYEHKGFVIDKKIKDDSFVKDYLSKLRGDNFWPDNSDMNFTLRIQYFSVIGGF